MLGPALAVVAVALCLSIAGAAVAAPSGQVLVVEGIDTGERYLTHPVDDGSTVALSYTHSVEKTPVYDEYRVEGETLVNTRMEFESYGWGLPSRVNVTNVNGTFVYDPPGPITTLETLSVSPGRIANHTLIVEDTRYDLVAETGARDVRIRVERRGLTDVFS
ncbi:C4-dicarboxylate ABC transporter [Halorubrum tropicale]|uniref:C4-dicarboxylate ABC transporter n=1 Tax=Halorubrum tropicale TaxID=1765655 RepID=A0A0M9AQP4_9EURY|nr:C4-dicarboxylate ABC transporter [Halorubrum tropicale]